MQHGSQEDQRQTHGNINYYYRTVIVNSFNVHNITMVNCYNNIPVTRSSFFPLLRSTYNLNIAILLLENSTDYRLAARLLFSTVAGLAVSCILAAYLCGKG